MERCEQRENQMDREEQALNPPPTTGEADNGSFTKSTFPFLRWEMLILKQIFVCIFIILFLWITAKIPRIGTGLVERFRYVLKYGENNRTEEKLTVFARQQWQKVKAQVSSWFTLEFRPVLAPSNRSIQLSLPLYFFDQQEITPQRIRYLLNPNTLVYAATSGVVTEIVRERGGWKLHLDHGEGWHTLYYPCAQVYVKIGEWVNPGQEIGHTGREFFWEITKDAKPVDPRTFLQGQGLWH